MTDGSQLTIMVSSTVYGIEELLDRIYTLLTGFGYDVWMSYKGTVPVFSDRSAFDNCIAAVEDCDLFLGLITPYYGSGREGDGLSITHRELLRAIELDKPRWLLVHDHVTFARSLLRNLRFQGREIRREVSLQRNPLMDDLRVIDMYEDAVRSQVPLRDRQGNWVQPYRADEDASLFATAQFSRYQEVEAFVRENFGDRDRVSGAGRERGDRP